MDINASFLTAFAGIPIGSLAVWFMYKLASNHMHEVRDSLDKLESSISDQTSIQLQFYSWLMGKMGEDIDASAWSPVSNEENK